MFGKVEILLEIINKPSCSKRILLKFQDFELSGYGVGVRIRMRIKTQGNTTAKDERNVGWVTFQSLDTSQECKMRGEIS